MSDLVLESLISTGVGYEIIDCDPDLADTASFCEHYGYQIEESVNAILVVGKSEPKKYAVCLALASTRIDVNKKVKKKLEVRKVSFASAEEAMQITSQTLGGITPFGLPKTLPLWIDSYVMECDEIIVGGGSRDRKIYLPPTALTMLPNSEVVEGLAKRHSRSVKE
ncbi:MAG TPA: YbaK/EbsC family protein [Acidimicrobiales bacterium]|nr:YbaK/EbsC family protein [Acidimicrobiales bacterium]|tara:strand:- start:350 stop:847 length:498 start_codon:yes stop_codon:yes gene_type:complete